jgi:prepilin-type N-terminal cleavage/methylation domain-containing protein
MRAQYKSEHGGFTLIEVLIVIAILVILGSIIGTNVFLARDRAYMSRALMEFRSLSQALEFYRIDRGEYPADVSRGLPPGLEAYLAGEHWPGAPWPGSVYDWDNWADPNFQGQRIIQFSIRFCPLGEINPANCNFPREAWAANFGVNSAVYYCVQGNCRSHIAEPIDYPGYCVNCE